MEKLDYKYQKVLRAQEACSRAIELYTHPPQHASESEHEAYLASVVKHFELFFEMLWKFFKHYLLITHGIETRGSKDVLRECHAKKLVNDKELEKFLDVIEKRNTTTHMYDEETATLICEEIVKIFPILQDFVRRIKL